MTAPASACETILGQAREQEQRDVSTAIELYRRAVAAAERAGDGRILAEALRRLAIQLHLRSETEPALALAQRSCEVARKLGHDVLAGEALNTLGGLHLQSGRLDDAHEAFLEALAMGGSSRELRAKTEQNLGIIANIRGDLDEALQRYRRSLEAYDADGNQHGCAIAYHNLGKVSAARGELDKAQRYYAQSREIAEQAADEPLRALCLLNHAEVDVARQRFENARQSAEAALALADRLDAPVLKADAYRIIGTVYRETGNAVRAEPLLRQAVELAAGSGGVLAEAEASRELALLYEASGRNIEALRLLGVAHRLFRQLDARADLVNIGGKVAQLEGTYLAAVRAWGQSLESNDDYTSGHCERVASLAVQIGRALGLDERTETTVLLGAYLHDVGMIRVPHEILAKPGPLTQREMAVLRQHPAWGVELLADVEFPWDLKPIIRWHHEHVDGSGYPDRLQGDEIPLAAQVVGIAEAYDALIRPRAGGVGAPAAAREVIAGSKGCWSERVLAAFRAAVPPADRADVAPPLSPIA